MSWLVGGWGHDWEVAAKALLMYVTAVAALRVSERRTVGQWTLIDVVTAVAMGAVVGRTAVSQAQSYVTGAVALVALLLAHRAASLLRFHPIGRRALDHRVRVLVTDGKVRTRELHRCGLTDSDLESHLRERGVFQLEGIKYVLYENKGSLTVVPTTAREGEDPALVQAAIDGSVGYP